MTTSQKDGTSESNGEPKISPAEVMKQTNGSNTDESSTTDRSNIRKATTNFCIVAVDDTVELLLSMVGLPFQKAKRERNEQSLSVGAKGRSDKPTCGVTPSTVSLSDRGWRMDARHLCSACVSGLTQQNPPDSPLTPQLSQHFREWD